jgi:hypothetical protein
LRAWSPPEAIVIWLNVWGGCMSSVNDWFAERDCGRPVDQRLPLEPSMALAGTSVPAVREALAVHPVRESAVFGGTAPAMTLKSQMDHHAVVPGLVSCRTWMNRAVCVAKVTITGFAVALPVVTALPQLIPSADTNTW